MRENILKARGKVKEDLERNKVLASGAIDILGEMGYPKKKKDWLVYDKPITSFGNTFMASLPTSYREDPRIKNIELSHKEMLSVGPHGDIFRRYIEDTLARGERHDLTAVEFGGPGSMLFAGFTYNFFKQTAGVCLKDVRDKDDKKSDRKNNHHLIEGDILDVESTETLGKVLKTFHAGKTDLIISRMVGPLSYIDKNSTILDRIIRNWNNLLNENGLMFIQFDWNRTNIVGPLVEKWAATIQKMFPEIDISVAEGVMRLHKRPGSPEKLPPVTQLFS